jgi:hypothetical protein
MLTLVIRRITKNKEEKAERAEKAEVQRITKGVKIRDKAKKGIIKTIIKVIRVMHDLQQYKAPLTNSRLTLALLKTIFTLTV